MSTLILDVDNQQKEMLFSIFKYLKIKYREAQDLTETEENYGLYHAMKKTLDEENLSEEETHLLFQNLKK